jgi:hypothetical protein
MDAAAKAAKKMTWPFSLVSNTEKMMATRAAELVWQTPNLSVIHIARKLNGQFGRALHLSNITTVRQMVWSEISRLGKWHEYNPTDRPRHVADFNNRPHDDKPKDDPPSPPKLVERPAPPPAKEYDRHGLDEAVRAACELLAEALGEHPFYVGVTVRVTDDGSKYILPEPRPMVIGPPAVKIVEPPAPVEAIPSAPPQAAVPQASGTTKNGADPGHGAQDAGSLEGSAGAPPSPKPHGNSYKRSPETKARMSAAQRARWAKAKGAQG